MLFLWSDMIKAGLYASMPGPSIPGRLYFASDTNELYLDQGVAWTLVSSAGMANPMNAQGDMIYGGAAGAGSRLAIGTANQQLRVNAGETAPEWFTPSASGGGALELIDSQELDGDSTVTFASIPQTYSKLLVDFLVKSSHASSRGSLTMTVNQDSTDGNYRFSMGAVYGSSENSFGGDNSREIYGWVPCDSAGDANRAAYGKIEIPFYRSAFYKQYHISVQSYQPWTDGLEEGEYKYVQWLGTGAITRIDFAIAGSTFHAGSIINLYGVS